ncbi:ABC transporter permease [Dyella sp. 20L07]|uniref:ABC transporter permease n=1 Tax=Dyella sp. 20L07 TaxID=3384240 RepID=UPI003D290B61
MRHVLKPLLRHRMMPTLVVLQVALACAIACNALFLLQQRLVPILAPVGIGSPEHLLIAHDIAARGDPWSTSRLHQAEMALRTIPGVSSASIAGSVPMISNVQMNGDMIGDGTGNKANGNVYIGTHMVDTLGLKLVAGRDFTEVEDSVQYPDVGINSSGPVLITRALADRLFPGQSPLGRVVRMGTDDDAARRTIVGVVEHLMRNQLTQDNRDIIDYTLVFPGIPGQWPIPTFGVRTNTPDLERVRKAVKSTIQRELGAEMLAGFEPRYDTFGELRDDALRQFRASVWLLSGVSLIVLLVALVGIMGLTSYWVQQRTRQIGIRRALGARRSNILRDVQLENLLVVGAGIVLGMALAYAINFWLMRHYELPRLPWPYLPVGALLILALGQLAVLGPALRAAAVPPVVATRSV